ncbi:MAG: ATP-binding protein [Syntrophorhabdales bacterium]|jgi:PAS domain S-box-containing protein
MPVDPKEIRALRRKAEKVLSKTPEKLALMPGVDLEKLVHELSVHQIELEMQNEELRKSQEGLEQSRSEYAELYDFAPVGYLTFDGRGLVTRANLTACGLFGVERSRLVKKPLTHFVHPQSQDLFYFHKQKVLEATTAQTCELVLKRKDGTFFGAQLESVAVQVNGQPAVNAIVTDINERKKAEATTRRLASFPDLNPNPVLEVDASGEVTFCNPATRAALTKLGMNERDRGAFVPEDLHAILAAWNGHTEVLLNREVLIGDRVFEEAIQLVPQFNAARIYGRDITARKQAEEALNEASRRLTEAKSEVDRIVEERTSELTKAYESLRVETEERRRAEAQLRQAHKMEAVGTLAGGIAHDFNNILAAIIGFSEIAQEKTPEESPARRHMERVFAAGIRGRDLVKQILAFSRQAEPEMHPLKLVAVVRETLKLLRASLPRTIDIRTNLRGESGSVLADPVQMQQVLMNLCTNAAHAMKRGGGRISIDLTGFAFSSPEDAPDPTMSPGSYARLSVTDTGVGMSPELLEHIFDPFFTTKAAGEGTGLGLSVVHGIVANHGGAITVSSEPGLGSTFTIYLPKVVVEQSRESADEGGSIPRGHESILFVDDEEDLITIGDAMLTDLGYRVTAKTDAREALALFRLDASRFDLVITDQTMPEMTGVELAGEICTIRPDMPIITCTGFSYVVDADSARAAGIKAFAMKPLTKREFARTIRKVLDE